MKETFRGAWGKREHICVDSTLYFKFLEKAFLLEKKRHYKRIFVYNYASWWKRSTLIALVAIREIFATKYTFSNMAAENRKSAWLFPTHAHIIHIRNMVI